MRMRIREAAALGLGIPTLALSAFAATAEQWKSRSIYQIVTDRFALGNGTYPPCNTTERTYCGGDWRGIINNLDYIQGMGFDAVWISPISTQVNETNEGMPYHGYWTGDLFSLNKHFGDENDLKGLVSALHAREMYLMLDVNVNHMGSNSTPANVSWLLPFMNETNYHQQCSIDDWNDQWQVENCWLGDENVVLPDLNTENQTVVDMLNLWVNETVDRFNVDGVRIHAAKHVRKDFWPAFTRNTSVFTMGEVMSDDVDYAADYTNVMDSLLDYPSYYHLQQAFSSPEGDLRALVDVLRRTQEKYRLGGFASGVFMESLDVPRFPALTRDEALVRNAMAWVFATDAMPVWYYGQEQGFSGERDPENREAMWVSGMRKSGGGEGSGSMVEYVTKLNKARKLAGKLSGGTFHETAVRVITPSSSSSSSSSNSNSTSANSTVALIKPPMLTLLSNGGTTSTPEWRVNAKETGYEANMELVDVLSCGVVRTGGDGGVVVRRGEGMPMVLVPKKAFEKETVCGLQETFSSGGGGGEGGERSMGGRMKVPGTVVVCALTVFAFLSLAM